MHKIPLVLEAQSEGGWTVTSPVIPELVTEIDNIDEMENTIKDAIAAVVELYEDVGKVFPDETRPESSTNKISFESLILAEA